MLWPEEYEPWRPEARAAAVAVAEAFDAGRPTRLMGDQAARVAAMRGMSANLERESPAGADEVLAGVPCRVFRAEKARGSYIHFHGGAMILGSARVSDLANAKLSRQLQVNVVSVDYRLAPEYPFPAGNIVAGANSGC